MASSDNREMVTGWVGWIGFASFLLLFAGFFHIIEGVAELTRHTVFLNGNTGTIWVLDYTKWGWSNIVLGILAITAGLSLAKGGMWGRVFASVVVLLSALGSVAMIPFYPIWGILVLAVEVLILYAIMVHGKEVKRLS